LAHQRKSLLKLQTIEKKSQLRLLQFGNPELNGGGGWGIFNAILGWQNSATYGSVISYNVYWIVVMIGFAIMRYRESKGHLPFMKAKAAIAAEETSSDRGIAAHEKQAIPTTRTLSGSAAGSSERDSADAEKHDNIPVGYIPSRVNTPAK
jgi:high-affinity Fe2+/Pb2+ permease